MDVEIFTDGACKGNPGPGGWGAILRAMKKDGEATEKEMSGSEAATTNNRMELTAAIRALQAESEQRHTTSEFQAVGPVASPVHASAAGVPPSALLTDELDLSKDEIDFRSDGSHVNVLHEDAKFVQIATGPASIRRLYASCTRRTRTT